MQINELPINKYLVLSCYGNLFAILDIETKIKYIVNNTGKVIAFGDDIDIVCSKFIKKTIMEKGHLKEKILDENGSFLYMGTKVDVLDAHCGIVCFSKKNHFYLISNDTSIAITKKSYDQIEAFPYCTLDNTKFYKVKKGNCYGVIDAETNTIIKSVYDDVDYISNVFTYKKNNKYGLVDIKGNKLTNCKYRKITPSINNLLIVENDNLMHGVIDKSGNIIIKPLYDEINIYKDSIVCKIENKPLDIVNTYDLKGTKKETFFASSVVPYGNIKKVIEKDRVYYIDENNHNIFNKTFYYGSNVVNNTVVVMEDISSSPYLLNLNGERLTNDSYIDLNYVNNNLLRTVKEGNNLTGNFGLIDINGTKLLEEIYDYVIPYEDFIKVKINGKYTLIDYNKKFLLDSFYDEISNPKNGLMITKSSNRYGLITSTEELLKPIYKNIKLLDNGNILKDLTVVKKEELINTTTNNNTCKLKKILKKDNI